MNNWNEQVDIERIKAYLQECAENDDYRYEEYQIDIMMHEYINQKLVINKLNNILNEIYTKANDTNITSLDLREYILNKIGCESNE